MTVFRVNDKCFLPLSLKQTFLNFLVLYRFYIRLVSFFILRPYPPILNVGDHPTICSRLRRGTTPMIYFQTVFSRISDVFLSSRVLHFQYIFLLVQRIQVLSSALISRDVSQTYPILIIVSNVLSVFPPWTSTFYNNFFARAVICSIFFFVYGA